MTLALDHSIFEDVATERLPVKPIRTERDFGVQQRRSLSASAIQSRIDQLVRRVGTVSSPRGLPDEFDADTRASINRLNLDGSALLTSKGSGTSSPDSPKPDTHSINKTAHLTRSKLDALLNLPKQPPQLFFSSTFSPIQEWEGYVRAIGPDTISADLVDITALERSITEQAEIPLDELSETAIKKLRIGSIFRWAIGYQRSPSGTKMRVSNIAFRDLPRWTQKDLREARDDALRLEQYFQASRANLPEF
jgi:hypothetical protein